MHFTFRCKLDAGTPTDRIEGAHVYLEMETVDDLEHLLPQLATAYAEAQEEGVGTAFLDSHVNRVFADGYQPSDRTREEVLANLLMARDHVAAVYENLRHTELGGGLENGSESLGAALADIAQAQRWLTGQEVPS